MTLKIVKPSLSLIESYNKSVRAGFKNMQLGFGNVPADEIEKDPEAYLKKLNSPEPFIVTLENCSKVFLVSKHEILWITDGKRFIGSFALRYEGDQEILDEYAGHIGLAIRSEFRSKKKVKQTSSFRTHKAWKVIYEDIFKRIKNHDLDRIYMTCDPCNIESKNLIEKLGGIFVDEMPDVLKQGPSLRYQIILP
jgi:predicted acetyltransferase